MFIREYNKTSTQVSETESANQIDMASYFSNAIYQHERNVDVVVESLECNQQSCIVMELSSKLAFGTKY